MQINQTHKPRKRLDMFYFKLSSLLSLLFDTKFSDMQAFIILTI